MNGHIWAVRIVVVHCVCTTTKLTTLPNTDQKDGTSNDTSGEAVKSGTCQGQRASEREARTARHDQQPAGRRVY